jgi:hypothetical protein
MPPGSPAYFASRSLIQIYSVTAVYLLSDHLHRCHLRVVQGRALFPESPIASTRWPVILLKKLPTDGPPSDAAMIKISAAEFSASGRCPGGKQHVRIHVVGPVAPGCGAHLATDF